MEKLLIGIVAVKSYHIKFTKNLIKNINANFNTNFLVLTDFPIEFIDFTNVKTLLYDKPIFSYHDKVIILKEAAKLSDTILLLDADTSIRDNYTFTDINIENIEPGIYPQLIWKFPANCCMENFLLGKNERVPYGLEYKNFCKEHNLSLDNALLIQESFLLVKKDECFNKFIEIWEMLGEFCNKKDIERNQTILGYGEGYSIGVAALNANFNIIENKEDVNKIIGMFKHYAWEKWEI